MSTSRDPIDRLLHRGAESLTNAEILAVVLGGESIDDTVIDQGEQWLRDDPGGFSSLLEDRDRLAPSERARLHAARELSVRLARERVAHFGVVQDPAATAAYLMRRYFVPDQEVFGAIYLNQGFGILDDRALFRGTLVRAAVEPRQVLRPALLLHATRVFVFHTHAIGDPTPSPEDIDFTRRLVDASEAVGIGLVDHLILAADGAWASLRSRGVVPR